MNNKYFYFSVSHAHSWKLLKPHMFAIIENVLLPLMSYSKADEELWSTDPHEYVRMKFGKSIGSYFITLHIVYKLS